MGKTVIIDNRSFDLTNTEKILFPSDGFTKGELIDYYRKIAPYMLPHLKNRPLTLHRFPDGIDAGGFYQQEASGHFPVWISRVSLKKEGGRIDHVVCTDTASLVYLANQACITFHTWLSRQALPNRPDLLVFDLDPPSGDFEPVRKAAFLLKDYLEEFGATSFVKTTGSRGLHVIIPLKDNSGFDQARRLARSLARGLADRHPDFLTVAQRKNNRAGRIFIDYLRNSYGQTAVAPYSVRAKPHAPVAIPVSWKDLEDPGLVSDTYNIKNVFGYLHKNRDPWEDLWINTVSIRGLSASMEKQKPKT